MDSTPISTQALPSGTRLEQFLIERVLGSGGFGITYLARDSRLNRPVVIKENLPVQFCFRDPGTLTVAPRHSQGDDAENFQWSLENFSKEAAMLASLDHPGIVRVLHSFEAYGTAYFVMPFVAGDTFDEQIRQSKSKPFSEAELRGLLDRVLSALDHIHQRGIYHRDIKPGNLLITHEGIPVLIDFGSARQRISERSMTVVESAGYTPFEQLQSRGNVGPWSDLYALGATLAKAITGETPPRAADRAFDDPFPPLARREMLQERFLPGFLEGVDRALQMRPQDRWQNAGEWKGHMLQAVAAPVQPPAEAVTVPAKVETIESPAIPTPPKQTIQERDFLLAYQTPVRMCWIPPGDFMMGSPIDELGRQDDETLHHVEISKGFWIGKYPVTQAQWRAVMGGNPSHFIGDNLPVENVSWNDICGDAQRAGGFLAKINSIAPAGSRFDLPTEAEWEYACRAGTVTALNHGHNLTAKDGECPHLDEVAWYQGNSYRRTHPTGQKKPNAWGLHDMHGNVSEWCVNWREIHSDEVAPDLADSTMSFKSAIRGGSWNSLAIFCRAACRNGLSPTVWSFNIGMRLVVRREEKIPDTILINP